MPRQDVYVNDERSAASLGADVTMSPFSWKQIWKSASAITRLECVTITKCLSFFISFNDLTKFDSAFSSNALVGSSRIIIPSLW